MSFLDLDQLSPASLVVQYVLECRGTGIFLPYQDYQVVDEWLTKAADADDLLLVLSDLLPEYFAKKSANQRPRSLSGVHKLVLSRLKDRAMTLAGNAAGDRE